MQQRSFRRSCLSSVFQVLLSLVLVAVYGVFSTGTATAQETIHVVQPGENLFRIGMRYGIGWQTLMAHNGMSSTQIYVGQTLAIPGITGILPEAQDRTSSDGIGNVTHEVQPGDTLFAIGLRYNVTWHALASLNGLSSTRIYVGQVLRIPERDQTASAQSTTEPIVPSVETGQYVVIPGDTLWSVAQRLGLAAGDLAAANGLTLYSWLYAGQTLRVPGGGSPGVQLQLQGVSQALPLDCESRSAVDWVAFFGVSINELDFFWALPVSDDPDAGFVGDVYGLWGQIPPAPYGVHADPVAAVLNQHGVSARAVHDSSWEEIKSELDAGRPVIVWVIGQVIGGTPQWYTASSGRSTLVAAYEHTVIVTGYGAGEVSFLDGGTIYRRSLAQFLDSWAVLGNMAVVKGS